MPAGKLSHENSMLGSVYIGALLVLMDLSAINIALPTIGAFFDMEPAEVSWLLILPMLTSSGFSMISGRLTELAGPRKLLLMGNASFMVLTFLCFVIKDFEWILAFRILQGFPQSLIYVMGPALIRHRLHFSRRQQSYGIWMMCTGIGIALGPFIGGLLVENPGWNYVFLINVPLALAGFVFALGMEKSKGSGAIWNKLDIPGSVLSFVFLALLVFGLGLARRKGIADPLVAGLLILSVVFLVLFLKQERKTRYPVFDLSLFRIRNFNLSMTGFFIFFFINVGSRFLRPYYFEEGLSLSPRESGYLMMVAPLVLVLVSGLSGFVGRFLSSYRMYLSGTVLLAVSTLMFCLWDGQSQTWFLVITMVILGVAMGLYYPVSSFVGMSGLPDGKHGMGSAAISVSKSLGKLMGVLVFSQIFTWLLLEAGNDIVGAFRIMFVIATGLAFLSVVLSVFLRRV